jgi:ubiquitin carboxyl-terminal hydrolase 36/42
MHVDAEKQFTIHEAPPVLTVHLKRFSPLGRKISHLLEYDDELSLRPFMSAGSFGPTYSLYGVICHAGGGPNSGHYYSFVKSREGRWLEMNDEYVTVSSVPVNKKNAYMLFYIQNKGQGLEAAVKAPLLNTNGPPMRNGLAAGMKKKVQRPKEPAEEKEDIGVKVDTRFIGPLLPSAEITPTKSPFASHEPHEPHRPSGYVSEGENRCHIEEAAKPSHGGVGQL